MIIYTWSTWTLDAPYTSDVFVKGPWLNKHHSDMPQNILHFLRIGMKCRVSKRRTREKKKKQVLKFHGSIKGKYPNQVGRLWTLNVRRSNVWPRKGSIKYPTNPNIQHPEKGFSLRLTGVIRLEMILTSNDHHFSSDAIILIPFVPHFNPIFQQLVPNHIYIMTIILVPFSCPQIGLQWVPKKNHQHNAP